MQKPQLILSDVDGTLIKNGPIIQPTIPEILQAVRDAGVHVAMVTGRGYTEILDIIAELGITGPSVFEGGASIVDCTSGEELWSQRISSDLTAWVVQQIAPHTTVMNWGLGDTHITDLVNTPTAVESPSIWAPLEKAKAVELAELFNAHAELSAHISVGMGNFTGMTNIQVTHKHADKYHGALALLDILNIDGAHTLAIGDGDNDMPLFEAAAIKVAMGNASEKLLAAADHITDTVDHDGFAKAMQQFVL